MTKNVKNQIGETALTKEVRSPIVVILGHVDHGKTTLLDKIRDTHVQEKEAGGITQGIGASVITTPEGKKITFIDTPGHAAFANMRSQGAKVADIAVLVVAADGGVKPQTKEAIEYILVAKIPFIVAITKMDMQTASLAKVKDELGREQILFEGSGGDIPLIALSGKTGKGIDELLEMITLVSELNEIGKIDKNDVGLLEAVVIETGKDNRGPFVSVVIRKGEINVGNEIVTETVRTKVRALFDFRGKSVKTALAGEPVQILGFGDLPTVGSRVWYTKDGASALQTNEKRQLQKNVKEDELPVVIKAGSAGSLEATLANVPEKVVIINSSVGNVNESDIFLAKSAGADIFAFESKASSDVKKLAMMEGVEIYTYKIIYKLFEKLEEIVEEGRVKILGKARVVEIFPFNKRKVAGCKVSEGVVRPSDKIILTRNEKELGEVKITSFKKGKEVIKQAIQGEECGIIFTPQLEFEVGDVLLSVRR
ncbi:GTP-binding protein [Patescibacteria group bacterium]|nr:GTP-binding protein [Patescibacteria group bacterium]